jgi:hypothetical protein
MRISSRNFDELKASSKRGKLGCRICTSTYTFDSGYHGWFDNGRFVDSYTQGSASTPQNKLGAMGMRRKILVIPVHHIEEKADHGLSSPSMVN